MQGEKPKKIQEDKTKEPAKKKQKQGPAEAAAPPEKPKPALRLPDDKTDIATEAISNHEAEVTLTLQGKLESIKTKRIPDLQEVYRKYQAEFVDFEMIRLANEFAHGRVSHSAYCEDIIQVIKGVAAEFPKSDTKQFKSAFGKKLVVFKKVVGEFSNVDSSINNVFDFIFLILESMNDMIEFDDAQAWFVRRLEHLITEKFTNSEITLLENVG